MASNLILFNDKVEYIAPVCNINSIQTESCILGTSGYGDEGKAGDDGTVHDYESDF